MCGEKCDAAAGTGGAKRRRRRATTMRTRRRRWLKTERGYVRSKGEGVLKGDDTG